MVFNTARKPCSIVTEINFRINCRVLLQWELKMADGLCVCVCVCVRDDKTVCVCVLYSTMMAGVKASTMARRDCSLKTSVNFDLWLLENLLQ